MTIPVDIREPAGAPPHTEVEFEFDAKVTPIVKPELAAAGARVAAHLRRRGGVAINTEAIMAPTRGD